jgi:hypothetical protein
MRTSFSVAALAISLLSFHFTVPAQDAKEPVRKASGLEKRVPWTTSKVIGSPEPPPPYKTEPAFPKLPKFDEPLDMTYAPGTDRLFVAERMGKIFSFVNKKDADKTDLALELKDKDGKKQTIYAFTFHPKFKENGFLYVTWIPDGSKEACRRGRVCRGSRSRGARRWPIAIPRRSSSNGPTAGTTAAASSSAPTVCSTSSPATAPASPTRSTSAKT